MDLSEIGRALKETRVELADVRPTLWNGHTAVFTTIGVFWNRQPQASVWLLLFPLVVLLGQCMAWFWLIRSYRQFNAVKWTVVGALEERLTYTGRGLPPKPQYRQPRSSVKQLVLQAEPQPEPDLIWRRDSRVCNAPALWLPLRWVPHKWVIHVDAGEDGAPF